MNNLFDMAKGFASDPKNMQMMKGLTTSQNLNFVSNALGANLKKQQKLQKEQQKLQKEQDKLKKIAKKLANGQSITAQEKALIQKQ